MGTIIKITNRLPLRNGDYVADVSEGKIIMVFEKRSVAHNTYKAMLDRKAEGKISYDDDCTIVRLVQGLTENEIVKQIVEEIKFTMKHKTRLQKVNYKLLS